VIDGTRRGELKTSPVTPANADSWPIFICRRATGTGILLVMTSVKRLRAERTLRVVLMLIVAALCWVAFTRLQSRRPPPASALARKIQAVEFDHVPLSRALDRLRDVSHLQFQVDWAALKAVGANGNTTVAVRLRDVRLDTALREVLNATRKDIAFDVEGDTVSISTPAALPRTVRVYDVSDLLSASMARFLAQRPDDSHTNSLFPMTKLVPATPPDTLIALSDLIEQTITLDERYKEGDNVPTIWLQSGHLIILHSHEGHRKVAELLRRIREADALQPWQKPVAKPADDRS
jgi:hypothetical protein